MRSPGFWYARRGTAAYLLAPAGAVFGLLGAARLRWSRPAKAGIPVICVGNVTVGGTGKTPVAIDLAERLVALGARPHILTRGYGAAIKGPHLIDLSTDSARTVGDEALLLARTAPTWIGGDRARSAKQAREAGADILVMDDGFQNPGLAKDLSLLIIDAPAGLGNGLLLPAGPLREPWRRAKARAEAIVMMGSTDETAVDVRQPDLDAFAGAVHRADLAADPSDVEKLRGQRIVAFAGIGRPFKFFDMLTTAGATLAEAVPYPDHHPFTDAEIHRLVDLAKHFGASLWTTEKDFVRLPEHCRSLVTPLRIAVKWSDIAAIERMLRTMLSSPPART